jgi:hypothetical protein
MKLCMKALSMLAFLCLTMPVDAGTRMVFDVAVFRAPDGSSGSAYGTMVDARGSADDMQIIGCSIVAGGIAWCSARNSAGVSGACSTANSDFVAAIRSVTDESYISFNWYNGGTCANLVIHKYSHFKPAAVAGN